MSVFFLIWESLLAALCWIGSDSVLHNYRSNVSVEFTDVICTFLLEFDDGFREVPGSGHCGRVLCQGVCASKVISQRGSSILQFPRA